MPDAEPRSSLASHEEKYPSPKNASPSPPPPDLSLLPHITSFIPPQCSSSGNHSMSRRSSQRLMSDLKSGGLNSHTCTKNRFKNDTGWSGRVTPMTCDQA